MTSGNGFFVAGCLGKRDCVLMATSGSTWIDPERTLIWSGVKGIVFEGDFGIKSTNERPVGIVTRQFI